MRQVLGGDRGSQRAAHGQQAQRARIVGVVQVKVEHLRPRVEALVQCSDRESPFARLGAWAQRVCAEAKAHLVSALAQALREVDDVTPHPSDSSAGRRERYAHRSAVW